MLSLNSVFQFFYILFISKNDIPSIISSIIMRSNEFVKQNTLYRILGDSQYTSMLKDIIFGTVNISTVSSQSLS